jgi:PKD repeat protein
MQRTPPPPSASRRAVTALLVIAVATGLMAAPVAAAVPGYDIIVPRASDGYRYQVVSQGAGAGFEAPGFDDEAFSDGAGIFGTSWGCAVDDLGLATAWAPGGDLLVRRTLALPNDARQLHLAMAVVGAVHVYVNGIDVTGGLVDGQNDCPSLDDVHVIVPDDALNRGGDNVIAIRARSVPGSAYFDLMAILVPVPANDYFADAASVASLPYLDEVSLLAASTEPGEPTDACPPYVTCTTAWYRFVPEATGPAMLDPTLPSGGGSQSLGVAVYAGDDMGTLDLVAYRRAFEDWRPLVVTLQAGTTYSIQVAGMNRPGWGGGEAVVSFTALPAPTVELWTSPAAPTTASSVTFWSSVDDPAFQPVSGYHWDFGDGATSTNSVPRHTFTIAGDYEVTLTVTMADGRTGSATRTVSIEPFEGELPVAQFIYWPEAPDTLTDVYFESTSYSEDGAMPIERWSWSFGDGTTGEGQWVHHRFAAAGEYEVILAIETHGGLTAATTRLVTVTQADLPGPEVSFSVWPSSPFVGQHATFYASLWDPAYAWFESVEWDFGDGGTASGAYVTHAFAEVGTYTVTVTATTWDGRTGMYSQDVTVTTPPPPDVHVYSYPWDPSSYDTIQFGVWTWDPVGVGIESYAWTFGDGSSSTDPYPSHRYGADGTYEVRLAVRTFDGREASASMTVTVQTRDVSITRLVTARSASAGQTKPVSVDIASRRATETVHVELFRSTPWGYQQVDQRTITVSTARSVRVAFDYLFTAEDASYGRVTFKVVATIVGYRDALPADNEAMSAATKVTK